MKWNNQFNIIYADPPWTFKTWSSKGKIKSPKYDVMTIEDIKNLPVNNLADNNCVLFIWVTYPLLKEGLETIKAWNFKYKTCGFSWIKKNKKADSLFWGLGYWTRANNEICLLATKGKGCKVLRKDIPQICDLPITKHSKKPDEIRKRIIKLFGDLPRIELFARSKIHGWSVWGNDQKLQNQPLENF